MKRLYALLAGVLLPFAFAPVNLFVLAVVSPALLLLLLEHTKPKEAFWRGLCYGIGFFGAGASWIYISIHDFGNSNIFVGGLITALFVFILALFPALNSYLFQKFFAKNHLLNYLVAFPALWTILEWVRSWLFTGFPWLLLGDSQTNSFLKGFAPIVGVYGVSFLVVLTSALLYVLYRRTQNKLSLGLLLGIWLVGFGLTHINWTKPIGQPFSVALVQGNIPQSTKWSAQEAENALNLYIGLTTKDNDAHLTIWPETAVTILTPAALDQLGKLDKLLNKQKRLVITGIPIPNAESGDANDYFNGAIVLGDGEGHYLKRHLVPFGEYVPFENIFGKLFGFLNIPMSDFLAGPQHQPLLSDSGLQLKIGMFICYEIAYSHLLRTDLPAANILTSISNDAWFGHSYAAAQQLQIAQFAALSTGRYMLATTNNGDTAIVDTHGNIIDKAPPYETQVLSDTVQGMSGSTPWVMIGNLPYLILLIAALGYIANREKRLKK